MLGDVRSFPTQTYQPFPFDPFQVPEHIMERPQEPLFAEAGDLRGRSLVATPTQCPGVPLADRDLRSGRP